MVYAAEPLVDPGPPGAFDHGNVQTAAEFLSYGGEHWVYYMGNPHSHEIMNRPKVAPFPDPDPRLNLRPSTAGGQSGEPD